MAPAMQGKPINNSTLHYAVVRHFHDHGRAPLIDELAAMFQLPRDAIVAGMHELRDAHGVVLHEHNSEVWVVHPYAAAPTLFWVKGKRQSWWGNCAWCSMGVAALAGEDVTVTTTLGGEDKQVVLKVSDGKLENANYFVHFPVPMQRVWDNVIYTCSTMLLFDSEAAVDDWCKRHGIAKGDVQPLAHVLEFAKAWYGRHLDPHWTKWSGAEAKAMFDRFDLTGPVWDLPGAASRF